MILLFDMKKTLATLFATVKKGFLLNLSLQKTTIKFPTTKLSQIVNLNFKEGSAPNRQYYTWVLPWVSP